MRTQVVKKDWPRKDYKFSVLDELSDAELDLEDCKKVIDFSRCAYSVSLGLNKIHIVYEKTDSTVNLV
jgi:hypothetical protein